MGEDEFRKKLNAEQYRVLRMRGTETEYGGKYWDNEDSGFYSCAACESRVFSSKDKFDAGRGWPSFRKPLKDSVEVTGARVICRNCRSHLGTLPNKEEYRINSVALVFKERDLLGALEEAKDTISDAGDSGNEDGSAPPSNSSLIGWLSQYAQFLGGSAAGLVLGGIAAFFLCHATCVPTNTIGAVTSKIATRTPSTALPIGKPRARSLPSPRVITSAATSAPLTTVTSTSSSSPVSNPGTLP